MEERYDRRAVKHSLDWARPATDFGEEGTKRPRGKIRHPLFVAVLVVATLGIYGYVWLYKVFKEVDDHSEQEHGTGLFVSGVLLLPILMVGGVLLTVYGGLEMDKLQRAKMQRDLPKGIGQGGYYGLVLGVAAAFSILLVGSLPFLMTAVFIGIESGLMNPFTIGVGVLVLILFVLLLVPYVVIQGQINKYWRMH